MAPTSQYSKKRDRLSGRCRVLPPTQGTIFIAPSRHPPFQLSAQGDGKMTHANRRWLKYGDIQQDDYLQNCGERTAGASPVPYAAQGGHAESGAIADRTIVSQSGHPLDTYTCRRLADLQPSSDGVIDLTSPDMEDEDLSPEQANPADIKKSQQIATPSGNRLMSAERPSEGFSEPSFASVRGGHLNAWTPGQEKALWQAQVSLSA